MQLCYIIVSVQQLRKMATGGSYWEMYDSYCSRSNLRELFVPALNKVASECDFDSVMSCSAIGPGDGFYEMEVIKKCAPNVTKITAVENDPESIERFKVNLRKMLPDIDGRVVEGDFRGWDGPSEPSDLVCMFHVLYYVGRQSLLSKAHDRWLKPGGYLAVMSASRTTTPRNPYEIFGRLGTPVTPWEDIEADILNVGFVRKHAYEIQYERDFTNPDESYLRFFLSHVDRPDTCTGTLDDVRMVMEELFPGGKTDQGFTMLAVFQKAP